MNSETRRKKYNTEHALLIFSWSDTCWERGIWRTGTYLFC